MRRLSRRSLLGSAGLAAAAGVAAGIAPPRPAQAASRRFSRVIDLTHTLGPDFPTFGGTPGLEFETVLESDSAALNGLVADLLERLGAAVHVLRDPTRGGVASALHEIAGQAGAGGGGGVSRPLNGRPAEPLPRPLAPPPRPHFLASQPPVGRPSLSEGSTKASAQAKLAALSSSNWGPTNRSVSPTRCASATHCRARSRRLSPQRRARLPDEPAAVVDRPIQVELLAKLDLPLPKDRLRSQDQDPLGAPG